MHAGMDKAVDEDTHANKVFCIKYKINLLLIIRKILTGN